MPSDDDVTPRAGSVWAMTGVTAPAFTARLSPFEHALAASLQDHTIAGQPRTSRRDSPYDNGPFPTIADTRLCMLTDVKQLSMQEVQGQLFGMSQAYANTWMHLPQAVLKRALAQHERLPAWNANACAVRFPTKRFVDVAEATAAVHFFYQSVERDVLSCEFTLDVHDLTFFSNAVPLYPEIAPLRR